MSDRQYVFNRVVKHLREQKIPSVEGSACKYRGPNGVKCAIGIFIPDEKYTPDLEGRSATSDEVLAVLPKKVKNLDADFLHAVQYRLHDDVDINPEDFLGCFEETAKKFAIDWELKYEEPKT